MDVGKQQSQAARIEALIQEVETFSDPQIRAATGELLHALLEMYGEGLARLLAMADRAETSGQALIEMFARDELVGPLLLLHGLHPIDLETRVRQAVESAQSAVQPRGGALEFVGFENGVATLRLTGSCHGCSSSAGALRQMVEEAIYNAAPDLDEIRVEGEAAPQRAATPVKFVPRRPRKEQLPANEPAGSRAVQEQSPARVSGTR